MLDYRAWAERALQFIEGLRTLPGTLNVQAELRAALTVSAVRELSGGLRLPLPEPLCTFLTVASSNCLCEYWWEPPAGNLRDRMLDVFPSHDFIFGGGSLCNSEHFAENEGGCLCAGEACEIPNEANLWVNSVPFHECGNGDYIALYLGDGRGSGESPVVYLDHDGGGWSQQLSPDFDQFLIAWEELRYIHGFFLREFFFDPVRRTLNPQSDKKLAMDELFRLGGWAS